MIALLSLWLVACGGSAGTAGTSGAGTSGVAAPALPDLGAVPAFSLQDQTGASVSPDRFAGKVWVANFIFTSCPDVCPLLSTQMSEVAKHYEGRDDIAFVSFSVDPVTDTPPVLAEYARRYGADPRWTFLTGDIAAVRTVVVDGFKQVLQSTPGATGEPATILHGKRFVVVDRKGHLRGFPDASTPGQAEVVAAADALLAEPR